MQQPKVIRTTLGDLVVAVTDEVMRFVEDPSSLYPAVSAVLDDVLTRQRRRSRKQYRRASRHHFAKTLH